MPSIRPPSIADVANKAGVSAMTVSRVMRNAAGVAPPTRRRVLRMAAALDYRPNPQFARLMALVRRSRKRGSQSVIAVIRDSFAGDELRDPVYQFVSFSDLSRQAEQHGYKMEEFSLGGNGLSARRLAQILESRGIEGIIVSPQTARGLAHRLDYSKFAASTLGYGIVRPQLHRASTNMMQGILDATRRLTGLGYERVGLAITRWIDARSDYAYSGAMLYYQQQVAAGSRVPLLLFPQNDIAEGREIFCEWIERHRPDVIISFDTCVQWLEGHLRLKVPRDVGLVVHDWVKGAGRFAGIDHRRPFVAAAAVDLVAAQLLRNEKGIPEVPRQVLISPVWVEGPSV